MNVIITPKAQKQYAHIPKTDQKKIIKKLALLEEFPFSGKKLDGEYAESRTIKAWPYKMFYYISEAEAILYVTSIIHRQGAYK